MRSCARSAAVLILGTLPLLSACAERQEPAPPKPNGPKPETTAPAEVNKYRTERQVMVRALNRVGKFDAKVMAAMRSVPRHEFVPEGWRKHAYDPHHPLPIGEDQTISAPDIVAIMTHVLDVQKEDRCLEIGTGSGYQAAVLAMLCKKVYTIEILEGLAKSAAARLKRLAYKNVHVRAGDGYKGWPEHAPFDKIIITAAPPTIPKPLVEQLKNGGRMVLPVGEPHDCDLVLLKKSAEGVVTKQKVLRVAFVPMVGEVQKQKPGKLDEVP